MLAEEKETPFLVNAAEWTAWASRMIGKQQKANKHRVNTATVTNWQRCQACEHLWHRVHAYYQAKSL